MQVSTMEICATVKEILGKMNEHVDARKEKNDNVSLVSEVAKGTDGGDRTTDDDHNIRFIRMFQEEVMKTLNEDIRTISGILVEHGKILQSLIVAVGPLANLKKEALEGNARMVECRKTQAKATDPPEATMVSKKAVGAKRGAIKISPPLKPTTRGDTARQRKTQKNRNSGPTKSAKLKCLELAFRPPEGMHFQGSEFAVAAYIFSKNLDEREILVADEHAQGDRRALWSLRPGQQVVDDKIALSPVNHNIDTFEFIWSNFMGYADNLHQIYVPMYREQHWYLMIVDLVFCRLIYLDFAKNASEYEARIAQMKYVMSTRCMTLTNSSCISSINKCDKGHYKPHPSTFNIDELEVGHQMEGSNDCGVWVVQWMMQSWVFRDFMHE
ncbi:hypothetical protein S83_007566, partial [Arachis hypogaea]